MLLVLGQNFVVAEDLKDYMDPLILKQIIENQDRDEMIYLIDVRTEAEFVSGHIPESRNIPVATIGSYPPTEDTSASIIVYCRSGARSGRAQNILREMGYENVYNFGGVWRWEWELETGAEADSADDGDCPCDEDN